MNNETVSYSNQTSTPALSGIVVVPDDFNELKRTMRHLRAQIAANRMEIVFVTGSRDQIPLDQLDLTCFHSFYIVEVGKVKSIGQGFTAGIRQAHAPVVALTEDHSFPDSRWADTFIARHREDWAVVGPCMQNENPVNVISWADFYQAYGDWAKPIPSGSPAHLPGHNSSYKRQILLSFEDRLEDLMQAESVMHRYLVGRGFKLLLTNETCTSHHNFSTWGQWIPSRYYTGRQYAATWSKKWSLARRCLYTCASPLIPFIRLWRVEKTIFRHERVSRSLLLIPPLFIGFIIESFGHMLGYAFGAGDASEKVARFEFHRIKLPERES